MKMSRSFPHAEDLNEEEIDFELRVRSQPEEVFKLDLTAKQRHLRNLLKNDQKEGRTYVSPHNIMDEVHHVNSRLMNLERALEKKVDPKYESRVLHYWYRIKWSQAEGEEQKGLKRDLVKKIERLMSCYQFGPPQSPIISQINSIIQSNQLVGEKSSVDGQAMGGNVHFSQNQDSGRQEFVPGKSLSPPRQDHQHSHQSFTAAGGYKFPESQPPYTGTVPKVRSDGLPQASNQPFTGPRIRQPAAGNTGGALDPEPEFRVTRREWEDMQMMMSFIVQKLSTCEPRDGGQTSARNTNQQNRASDVRSNRVVQEDSDEEDTRPGLPRDTPRRPIPVVRGDSDYASSTQQENYGGHRIFGHPHDNPYFRRHRAESN